MRIRTPLLRAALTALLIGCVASAGFAQERPLCSQVPASEREQARERGVCRDAPVAVTPRTIESSPTVRALATIAVPDLRGQMYDAKDERIARFRVITSSKASEQARGWVLDQAPLPPGRLAAAGELKLVLSDGSLVRVPMVRGNELATAQALLKRAGLTGSVRDEAGEPKGRVLSQTPQEGTPVKRGSAVTLGVAQGRTADGIASKLNETGPLAQLPEPSSTVPDLRGQMFNPSDERIARFRVATSLQPGEQARGWVLDQDPRPPARLARGGELKVLLSDNSLVRVPKVRDDTLANAQALLKRAGLADSVREEKQEPKGRVLSQSPQEGALVKRGSTVALVVAAGAPSPEPAAPTLLPVPNVVGLTYEEARARLARFSLQRSYRESIEPGGTVVDQDPLPPAMLPAAAPVRVVLSDGSLVRVPRFVEMSIAEARQRLSASAELKLQTTVVEGSTRAGIVVGQEPPPGAVVKRGSALRLQVSAGPEGPELIDVPNVVRLPLQSAQSRLERFKVEWTEQPSRVPAGRVISQSPKTPARAAPGTTVQLIVSSGVAPAELFELPNVVGRSFGDAQRVLAEFRVSRVPKGSSAPRDEVLVQTPAAGAMVSPGAAVALEVSDGSRVRVPELRNRTVAAARGAADAAGVRLQPDHAPPDAMVIAQRPDAEVEVRRGSAVLVEVAPTAVPPASTAPPASPVPTPPSATPPSATPPTSTPSSATPPSPAASTETPSAPSSSPVSTLVYAFGGATLLGFGALLLTPGGRTLLKRVTHPRPPSNIEVSARIDTALAETHIEGAEPSEPEIGLSARLESGTTTIEIEDQE